VDARDDSSWSCSVPIPQPQVRASSPRTQASLDREAPPLFTPYPGCGGTSGQRLQSCNKWRWIGAPTNLVARVILFPSSAWHEHHATHAARVLFCFFLLSLSCCCRHDVPPARGGQAREQRTGSHQFEYGSCMAIGWVLPRGIHARPRLAIWQSCSTCERACATQRAACRPHTTPQHTQKG